MRSLLASGVLGALGLAWVAPAHAEPAPIHVQIDSTASCPNAAQLRDQLAPLLAPGTALTVDGSAPSSTVRSALVRDLGDQYSVATQEAQRELDDPARNCIERARVASVFIALNLNEQSAVPEPRRVEPEPEPAAEPDEPEEPVDSADDGRGVGLELFGAAAYSTEIDRAAPGAGAGVWIAPNALLFGFRAALLAPADVALDIADDARGTVALMRIPLTWSASYLFRIGSALQLGPSVGLNLDVLHLRGRNVAQPETELRLNPGALLALDAHLRLARGILGVLRLSASAYPRAYRLSVERTGQVGNTPRLWLGATLGMGWQI